jgi:orotate phosphoribosyltransferase
MTHDITLDDGQKRFVTFLIQNQVLQFGEFVTKSGRHTPFFLNFGQVCEGGQVKTLGALYADRIVRECGTGPFVIFGPAYKGIPLGVATAIGLCELGYEARYLFNRKEAKAHGETGRYVGKMPAKGETVVVVDDVVTAGTTLREIIPEVKGLCTDATFAGVVVGVDRNERGIVSSARVEAEEAFGTRVRPIVSMKQVIAFLSNPNPSSKVLSDGELEACHRYVSLYGAE